MDPIIRISLSDEQGEIGSIKCSNSQFAAEILEQLKSDAPKLRVKLECRGGTGKDV